MSFIVFTSTLNKKNINMKEGGNMARIYFTMQELESMKFRELPNMVYEKILQDLEKLFGFLTSKLLEIFNNTPVMELDQYVNIWKCIKVI